MPSSIFILKTFPTISERSVNPKYIHDTLIFKKFEKKHQNRHYKLAQAQGAFSGAFFELFENQSIVSMFEGKVGNFFDRNHIECEN